MKAKTKQNVIDQVARRTGVKRDAVALVVGDLLEIIQTEVVKGQKVTFRGFGAFYACKQKARMVRRLSTNEPLLMEARYVPKFKVYPDFKECVMGGLREQAERD